ncbi:MAG: GNAT family N-acetyltransferase [Candidatus Eremiobacteraeota bacterium]|nr:GNAT family N-acetyltransferase [Candidatus Eremiobacteraeota bacterium]
MNYLVRFDRSAATRGSLVVAADDSRIFGVANFGRQITLASEPHALEAFAEYAKRHRGERTIVGPRATVRAFWQLIRNGRPQPRLVRERQWVMAIDRARLRSWPHAVRVRHARNDEWQAVVESSALMIEHEIDYDPRRTSPDFVANVREMIARERWWVGEWNGRLCFFCSIGPWCDQTAQLQGVWTPPDLRGKGLATASLAAICDGLLEASPTLSLYVNDFNQPAIALYRRVGFEHVSDFQTLLF